MSDFGDPGGPSGSRPPRQSSAKFLSRLKQKRLVGDDSDDYEDDGTGMEDDMEYNPELGKKRYQYLSHPGMETLGVLPSIWMSIF